MVALNASLPRFAEMLDPRTDEVWVIHLNHPVCLLRVCEDAHGAFTGLEHVIGWGDPLTPAHHPARLMREAGEWYLDVLEAADE